MKLQKYLQTGLKTQSQRGFNLPPHHLVITNFPVKRLIVFSTETFSSV